MYNSVVRAKRRERGAVAVMTAILAALLLTVGALAVDLGNSWARKRSLQKQVDVAAMSASYLMPVKTGGERQAVADAVAKSFKETENGVFAQDVNLNGAQLISQGLVTFQHDDGTTCNVGDLCTQFSVTTPESRVSFGMANVIGQDGADVVAQATVRIESQLPRKQDTLPFWLPTGCANGSAQIDTTQNGNNNNNNPNNSPTPTTTAPAPTSPSTTAPTASPTGAVVIGPTNSGNHNIAGTSPRTVTQDSTSDISGQSVTNVPNNTDRASIRYVAPGNAFYVDYAVNESNPSGTVMVPQYTVTSAVTSTPGEWHVYAVIRDKGGSVNNPKPDKYSTNYLIFNVTPTTPVSSAPTSAPTSATVSATATATSIPVGCLGQDRGNFGQLDSPRKDGPNLGQAFPYNIAAGLDHYLDYYRNLPAGTLVCSSPNGQVLPNLVPGAKLDDNTNDGNNCLNPNTGNDGPKIFDGLIKGVSNPDYKGRLDASVAGRATTCPNRPVVTYGSVTINNDTLSCFLRNNATLTQIAADTGVNQNMLDPTVTRSPRFVWIPVVAANSRAEKGFQPIVEFVPGFITDETQTSAATDDNGIKVQGNSVSVLTIYIFNKDALPDDEQNRSEPYNEEVGRPIARLVG